MSNGSASELHERFFKLWAKVSMLCVDGRRYPYYLYDTLAETLDLPPYDPRQHAGQLYQMLNLAVVAALVNKGWLEAATAALQTVLEGPCPVFVEFQTSKLRRDYFVGANIGGILAGTKNGNVYGFHVFASHQVVDAEAVRSYRFRYFDHGVAAARKGCPCYWLGSVDHSQSATQ